MLHPASPPRTAEAHDIELVALSSPRPPHAPMSGPGQALDDEHATAVLMASDSATSRGSSRPSYWQTAKRAARAAGLLGLAAYSGARVHAYMHPRATAQRLPTPLCPTNASTSGNATQPPHPSHPLYEVIANRPAREHFRYGEIAVDTALNRTFPAAVEYLMRSSGNRNTLEKLKKIEPELFNDTAIIPKPGSMQLASNDHIPRLTIDRGVDSQYIPVLNKLFWNDTHKYAVVDESAPNGIGMLSAAGGLMHELTHAEHKADNPLAATVRMVMVHPEFDTIEEKVTIEKLNARKGADFPEAHRTDHHAIVAMPAHNVSDADPGDIPPDVATRLVSMPSPYLDDTIEHYVGAQFAYQQMKTRLFAAALVNQPSFNRTLIEQLAAMANRAEAMTSRYVRSKTAGVAGPAEIEEVASYSRAVEDIAARMVHVRHQRP